MITVEKNLFELRDSIAALRIDLCMYSYMMFTCQKRNQKECTINFRQRHANKDWLLRFAVSKSLSTCQNFPLTDSELVKTVCASHLELCDILKHHVHVIVEAAQSADKLFVALQNDPDLRSCHRKIPVLYDLFAVRHNNSPQTILRTAMGPCKFVHSAQHDRTGWRHYRGKQK